MRVAVVCLGNICRSPMGAAVLRKAIEVEQLSDRVEITSAGTANYHVGKSADSRARAVLRARGYEDGHTARQFTAADLSRHDLVLAMDSSNLEDLLALSDDPHMRDKVRLFRSFSIVVKDGGSSTETGAEPGIEPPAGTDVPDPYYDGSFETVIDIIEAEGPSIVAYLRDEALG